MIYAYYRVSTDKQDYESQKIGVVEYANRAGLTIEKEYIDDGVSGTILASKRELGKLLNVMQAGDIIITSELSRLGRSTADVINTCTRIAKTGVNCYMVKQGMSIDQTPMGKMMIAIFAAFSEMERDLISQRTKEGLARVKLSGGKIGRPAGVPNKTNKLDPYADKIKKLVDAGCSVARIALVLQVAPQTVGKYIALHPELEYAKKRFYRNDPEVVEKKIKAKKRKNALGKIRYRQNREKILARQKEYNAQHRKERNEYGRQWYLKNKEKRIKQINEYRADPVVKEHLKQCARARCIVRKDEINERQRANYAKRTPKEDK